MGQAATKNVVNLRNRLTPTLEKALKKRDDFTAEQGEPSCRSPLPEYTHFLLTCFRAYFVLISYLFCSLTNSFTPFPSPNAVVRHAKENEATAKRLNTKYTDPNALLTGFRRDEHEGTDNEEWLR
jgi:hypothetical protein